MNEEEMKVFDFDKVYRLFVEPNSGLNCFEVRGKNGTRTGTFIIYLIPLDKDGNDLLCNGQPYNYGIEINKRII
jgi:hypothetical protein